MSTLTNIPYDQLSIGDKATYTKVLTEQDLILFATVSGDYNPVHLDEEFAKTTQFGERIAHGMWIGALISAALAMKLPGPGGIYLGQDIKFKRPAKLGDTITVNLEILSKLDSRKITIIGTTVINQHKQIIAKGEAKVMPAIEQVKVSPVVLPEVTIEAKEDLLV